MSLSHAAAAASRSLKGNAGKSIVNSVRATAGAASRSTHFMLNDEVLEGAAPLRLHLHHDADLQDAAATAPSNERPSSLRHASSSLMARLVKPAGPQVGRYFNEGLLANAANVNDGSATSLAPDSVYDIFEELQRLSRNGVEELVQCDNAASQQ